MFKTITAGLLGSIFPQPVWSSGGMGGGGSIPDDDGDEGDLGGDESDIDDDIDPFEAAGRGKKKDDDSDDDSKISLEGKDFLEQFWDEGDDENEDDDEDAGDDEESQKAIGEELKAMINGLTIPEDLIPEDFDPADPKQFRDVVGKIQRQTAALTLKAVFKPMAAALNQQAVRMRKEYQEYVEQHSSGSSIRSRLIDEIPAAGDRKHRQIVNMVMKQAATKFPKDQENQLRSARKALAALGITKNTRTSGGQGRSSGGSLDSVLDSFAPLPRKAEGRASGRMRTR